MSAKNGNKHDRNDQETLLHVVELRNYVDQNEYLSGKSFKQKPLPLFFKIRFTFELRIYRWLLNYTGSAILTFYVRKTNPFNFYF